MVVCGAMGTMMVEVVGYRSLRGDGDYECWGLWAIED